MTHSTPDTEGRQRSSVYQLPSNASEAALRFAAEVHRADHFLNYLAHARRLTDRADTARRAEAGTAKRRMERRELSPGDRRVYLPWPVTPYDFKPNESYVAEVVFIRLVDNFLKYLADLASLVGQSDPAWNGSADEIPVELLLQVGAGRETERLSFLSLRKIAGHLKGQAGFDLFPNTADFTRALFLVELRNIIVHNRSVVSRVAARRQPKWAEHVGKRLVLKMPELTTHRRRILNLVLRIDARAVAAFPLRF
jgi:hypothetical protein